MRHIPFSKIPYIAHSAFDNRPVDTDAGNFRILRQGEFYAQDRFACFRREHRSGPLGDVFEVTGVGYDQATGDHVLVELVIRTQSQFRDMDIFGRYGGDEFVVLMPDVDLQEACEVAERIKDAVSRSHFSIGLEQTPVTVSLGVAQITPQDTFAGLLNRANNCMYHAKENGRNRIES